MQIELFKSIVQEQRKRFLSVSFAPIALIADEDADLRRPVEMIDVDKTRITDQLIVCDVDDAVVMLLCELFKEFPFTVDGNNR